MAGRSYYEILGIGRNASADEIQKAYRKLAREWHPDVNTTPNAESRFKEITEANDVLSDPETRKKYDAFGADFRKVPDGTDPNMWARAQQGNRGGFSTGGFGPMGGMGGQGGPSLEDLLGGLFGQGSGPRQPPPNYDQTVEVVLTVEEAFSGGERTLTISGARGQRNVTVSIPPGVTEGQKIRIRGEGAGPTTSAGDLFLVVSLAPHPLLTVDGRDISLKLEVSPWEAALGAKVTVKIPSGDTNIKIPPGTSSGKKLRLRGKGFPNRRGTAGDLYAIVSIVVPKELSEREQELFELLAKDSEFTPRES